MVEKSISSDWMMRAIDPKNPISSRDYNIIAPAIRNFNFLPINEASLVITFSSGQLISNNNMRLI